MIQTTYPTAQSVKYGGCGVMAWACMAATGTGSFMFIDDVTADGSRTNVKVYRNFSKYLHTSLLCLPKIFVQEAEMMFHFQCRAGFW